MTVLTIGRRRKCTKLIIVLLLVCFVGIAYILYFPDDVDHCKQYDVWKANYYNYDPKKERNPHTVKLHISATHLCEDKPEPYLFIMIPSATENFEKRSAIRNTWKTYGDNVKLFKEFGQIVVIAFLLGTPPSIEVSERIRKESDTYSDIIQGDFEDIYRNLLTKMLMGFNWKIQHCSKAKYLVKVDDDAYLDIPNLIRYLLNEDTKYYQNLHRTPGRIYGHVWKGARPNRKGKYSVTCDEYPFKLYGNYLGGNCYIIHRDLVSKLFRMSEYFPDMYLDDIHITGTLSSVLGVELVHNLDFTLDLSPLQESACNFHYYNRISRTGVDVITMNQLWSIKQNKIACDAPSYFARLKHFISEEK